MRRALTVLALILPAGHLAGQVGVAPIPRKKIPAIALLPDGSELQKVMLPRYDKDRNLIGVLKAEAMTLVSAGKIAGRTITIEFFNNDQSPRGRIDLTRALFDQERGLIIAREPVDLKTQRMFASGSGLYYAFEQGKGFLSGPVTTSITAAPTDTTMKSPKSTPLRTAAMLGMAMVSQPLSAAPPPPLSTAEAAQLEADATSKSAKAAESNTQSRAGLQEDLAASAAASQAAASFLSQADLPAPPPGAVPTAPAPLEVTTTPHDTVIKCDGGMYFDADEGVLVYLKNVTVKDARFDLTGANELKIFFGKKKPKEASTPEEDSSDGGFGNVGANFGEVDRIVATGAVKISQCATGDKKPIQASGALFTYNLKQKQIIISGGYPWVTQGTTFMRARQPDLLLRIFPETGSFTTEGHWEMGGSLDQTKR